MNSAKYYCILFTLLLALSCCKRDNSTPPNIFSEASYPLAVGNWWKYQFTSSGSYPDTFTLRVDSMIIQSPYTKFICNYVGNGAIISAGYFLQSDTSLSFVQPYGYFTSFPSFHLRFPVETGQYWAGEFRGDSIMVVGVADKCEGGGGYFSPCYSLVESYNLPHNFKVNDMLLTPKVGLVRQSISFNSDTPGVQIQQSVALISYHVQ